ncbi:MAG: tetratricopeptide repeat protein [Thermodesulfobacteriota bacterium]|nr:tetratricopeptide repeat protein [Thermodesulfobacteriota bacterium]
MGNKFLLYSCSDFFLVFSLFFFFTLGLATNAGADSRPVVSNPEIVLRGAQNQPAWMAFWEKARTALRQGESQEAAAAYRELFTEKPVIEEALREYAQVLMDLKQWHEARAVLQKLLEIDPDSLEYQFYGGQVAFALKRYRRASKYMGLVYTMSPDGPWAVEALKGQIASLQKLGRKNMAYPLMEQLYLLVPHQEDSIRRLAQDSMQLGFTRKAQSYYKTLITEFGGTEQDFLEAEPLFEASGDMDMAVRCWQGYLAIHPSYIPFHKKLSRYYLENKQEQKALPHFLVRIAQGEDTPEIFLQTGKLYLYQEGRPDKSLYYYEEYRKRRPGDRKILSEIKRIQAVLANDLLVIVENEGAWTLWRDLAKVIPDRLAVYYSMAEQLESSGKEEELLEVLEIIHTHNPDDQTVLFKLAHLYFSRGDLTACTAALDSLMVEKQSGKEYFFLRAGIEERRGLQSKALGYYKQYLQDNPDDYPVIFDSMRFAADLGLVHELHYYYNLLPDKSKNRAVCQQGSLLYGEGLLSNRLYSTAGKFYRDLLNSCKFSKEERYFVKLQIIKTLQLEKKFFDAEQQLRNLLIEEGGRDELVYQLIQTTLLDKDWNRAWKWYEVLVHGYSVELYDHFIQKVQIYAVSGQVTVAIAMVEDYLAEDEFSCSDQTTQCIQLNTMLAQFYISNKEYSKAKEVLDPVLLESPESLALRILEKRIHQGLSGDIDSFHFSQQDEIHSGNLLDNAFLYEEYGDHPTALKYTERYLQNMPTALNARVFHAQLLMESGDDYAALSLYKDLTHEFPQELSFQQTINDLEFKIAKFSHLIEELAPHWQEVKVDQPLLAPRTVPPEVASLNNTNKLLLARTFWATKRWNDALLLYESLLQPPVDQEFSAKLEEENISLILPPPERSFLNVVTFTTPAEPDRLSVVMSPDFTRENIEKPVVAVAAKLYTSYRWQQLVSSELSVRSAMSDGNYYQAMKEYQNLLDDDSSGESLFDLAGVYSRLGFSGKEAALYDIIKQKSPGFPGLDEAIQRNSFKRQPRAISFFALDKKTGRDGYYDNKQRAGGLQTWFMPSLKHEFLFDARRIYSKSEKVDQDLWSNRLHAELTWSPVYDLDFLVGVGEYFTDGESGSTFLYNLRANGRIGDMVQGYLGLAGDVVDDTVESLTESISKKEYQAGISLDFLPRLFGGCEYLFTEYSDGNHQNRYELWSSYILHSEPTLLMLRYGYEYFHNAETNERRDYSYASGFAPSDHPYWTPREYWQNLFTVSFEHQLAEDVFGRGVPSYYSLEYSFGYEIGGYDNHEVKAEIFLEMSRHFLLNSNLEYTQGANYEELNFLFSVIYRW